MPKRIDDPPDFVPIDPALYTLESPHKGRRGGRRQGAGAPQAKAVMRSSAEHPERFQTIEAPRPRGGRRPGAGAPKGNVNSLKTGRHSTRFYTAALMIAVIPEVREIFEAIKVQAEYKERQKYLTLIKLAIEATAVDPELARTIRAQVAKRVRERLFEIRTDDPVIQNLISQSNNQTAR